MKTRACVLLVFSTSTTALPGCFEEQPCPAGQVLVHDGTYSNDGVCVARSYPSKTSGGASSTPAAGTSSSPPPAAPTVGGSSGAPADSGSTVSGACGGVAAHGDSVRVVNKSDAAPSFGGASPNLADGSYSLVQATFYRAGQTATPVRSLSAGLDVHGPTLTVNARDTSVAGLQDESLTFLLTSGVMTKTCESVHGSVSAWFFPFSVGGNTQPQVIYDAASSSIRLVVSRADGATELVFAR